MTIRVLLVDDQELLREGLAMMLDAQPDIEVVGQANDGAAGVAAAQRLDPDVILMDIRMPNLDGVQATRQIVAAHPSGQGPQMIVLTTFDLDEYVVAALQAGASGFLLKDSTAADIVGAVRAVAAGNALLAPTVTRRLIDRFVARGELANIGAPPGLEELTDREREVMGLVVGGLSNPEIGARLYLSEATVKTHVGRILMKLGVRDRVHLVILAYEHGLVPRGDV